MTRLALVLVLGLTLDPGSGNLLDGHFGLRAKRMVKPSSGPRRPAPPPTAEPVDWDVPPGPEQDGVITAEVGPLVEATQTIWALAGSRSWTGCSAIASEAAKQIWNAGEDVNTLNADHQWALKAADCPNAPEVLAMAARTELMRRFDLAEGTDGKTDLTLHEQQFGESRAVALEWISDAETELERRQDPSTLGLDYWRARALLSMGDLDAAALGFQAVLANRSIDSWRVRRLLALTLLYKGDLHAALVQAFRAAIDSPAADRLAADYTLALVLDRSGDTAGSRRRMRDALDRDTDGRIRSALELALPIHERLYLRAFSQTVRGESANAIRWWDAYLARPEPEAPERRLAERHRQALEPLPTNLGGVARPGEAPEG